MEIVAAGVETQADGMIGHLALEGLGIEIAGALVEQARDEIGAAGGVVRIARRAAVEGEIDRDQRQAVLLDQPGFDAGGRADFLHGDRGGRQASKERLEWARSCRFLSADDNRPRLFKMEQSGQAGSRRPVTERSGLR